MLIIEGVDFSKKILYEGIKWGLTDIDSEDSGRETMDALMYRSILAQKVDLDITLTPMDAAQTRLLMELISNNKYLSAQYYDAKNGITTKTFYNATREATMYRIHQTKGPLWENISFKLTER